VALSGLPSLGNDGKAGTDVSTAERSANICSDPVTSSLHGESFLACSQPNLTTLPEEEGGGNCQQVLRETSSDGGRRDKPPRPQLATNRTKKGPSARPAAPPPLQRTATEAIINPMATGHQRIQDTYSQRRQYPRYTSLCPSMTPCQPPKSSYERDV
jgi:hypothetical protein